MDFKFADPGEFEKTINPERRPAVFVNTLISRTRIIIILVLAAILLSFHNTYALSVGSEKTNIMEHTIENIAGIAVETMSEKKNSELLENKVDKIKKKVEEDARKKREKKRKEEEKRKKLERKKKREEELKKKIEEQKKLEQEYLGKNTDSNQTQIENDVDDDPDLNKDNSDSGSELKNDNNWNGKRLSKNAGTIQGPSGKETYYNLNMSGVVSIMRGMGFSEKEYPYHVRKDGAKCLGDYIMVAANLQLRPRGSLVETSLGMGLVCDTGGFAKHNITQLDLAVNW